MTRNVHREARTLFDRHIKPLLDDIRNSQGAEDGSTSPPASCTTCAASLAGRSPTTERLTRSTNGAWRRTTTRTS
jgi:hypothetical protein